MELRFRSKLSENLGEICHMVSRNELFCQNFCRNSSREHCSLNRASLEELNSWKIHENHPGNIHHLNKSTQKIPSHKLSHFFKSQKRFFVCQIFIDFDCDSAVITKLPRVAEDNFLPGGKRGAGL